jgi:hypothetical protein
MIDQVDCRAYVRRCIGFDKPCLVAGSDQEESEPQGQGEKEQGYLDQGSSPMIPGFLC